MRRIIAAAVMAAALAFPLGAFANHTFTDVSTSSTFHADIEAIKEAGVTTGCGATTYCPKDYVTREQMAAFLNRLGAFGPGTIPVANAATAETAETAATAGSADVADDAEALDGLDSSQFVRSDQLVGGHANCLGAEMLPENPVVEYLKTGGALYVESSGPQFFFCPLSFPDGATVTSLRARVRDVETNGQVTCLLLRFPLLESGSTTTMGLTQGSGVAGAPGDVVIADLAIVSATIDNEAYEYVGRCQFVGSLGSTGLYAYSVAYTVPGPAVP